VVLRGRSGRQAGGVQRAPPATCPERMMDCENVPLLESSASVTVLPALKRIFSLGADGASYHAAERDQSGAPTPEVQTDGVGGQRHQRGAVGRERRYEVRRRAAGRDEAPVGHRHGGQPQASSPVSFARSLSAERRARHSRHDGGRARLCEVDEDQVHLAGEERRDGKGHGAVLDGERGCVQPLRGNIVVRLNPHCVVRQRDGRPVR
jgi:hypothetical protein